MTSTGPIAAHPVQNPGNVAFRDRPVSQQLIVALASRLRPRSRAAPLHIDFTRLASCTLKLEPIAIDPFGGRPVILTGVDLAKSQKRRFSVVPACLSSGQTQRRGWGCRCFVAGRRLVHTGC